MNQKLAREHQGLSAMRSRPVLANPMTIITGRQQELNFTIGNARHLVGASLLKASGEIGNLSATVRALSPAATMDRGYAVVQVGDGSVLRDTSQAIPGDRLRIRLARGDVGATVDAGEPSAKKPRATKTPTTAAAPAAD
jgi:exodeoxyribonuclease VII large subunit